MDNVVYFNKVKKEHLKEERRNRRKSKKLFNDVNRFILKNEDFREDEYYNYLFDDFLKIRSEFKNKKWNDKNDLLFFSKFENITYSDDKINKYTNMLEYIRLYSKNKNDLLKLSDEIIKVILDLTQFYYDDINDFDKIIYWFNNPVIKKSLDTEKDYKKKLYLAEELAQEILDGYSPLDFALSVNNKKEDYNDSIEKDDDLSTGIITIDRIQEYYLKQIYYLNCLNESMVPDNEISNIEKMLIIKNYGNNAELKFIKLTQIILKNYDNLVDRIKFMSNLVEIFIYYDKKIEKLEIEDLLIILSYKKISEVSMEEAAQSYEESKRRL